MRITVLAVPPLLSRIHASLNLDEKSVGALTALPTLLFSVAAVGGALLVARVGPRRAVIGGLLVAAIAGALRGAGPSVDALFGFTLLMGVGISLVQPAFPALVRLWSPARIGLATAVYSTGLLIGEATPPAATAPVVLPLTGGWEGALAAWSLPVAVGAVLVALLTFRDRAPARSGPLVWRPDWRSSRTWRLGLMLGSDSALYWSCNAFIPDYLHHTGRPELIAPALIALNAGQIPAGIVIAALPDSLLTKRWAYWVPGALMAVGLALLVLGPGALPVTAAAILGFLSAWVFVLALTLPPLLAVPADVPRLAAAMFTITYVCPFLASVAGGAAWDLTGAPPLVFVPAVVAAGGVAVMAAGLKLPRHAVPATAVTPA